MKRNWRCTLIQFIVYMYTASGEVNIYSDDGKRFKCPLDPLTDRYPDPTDPTCSHYFLCHLGHAFPRRCDVRRAFHPTLKECYPRYQVPEDLCALPVDCDYNEYMIDPDDCTKYYICFFHQAIHYSCLANYYFDTKKSLCIRDKKKSDSCSKPKPLKEPKVGPLFQPFKSQRTETGSLQKDLLLPPVENGDIVVGGSEVESDEILSSPISSRRKFSPTDINAPSVLRTSDY